VHKPVDQRSLLHAIVDSSDDAIVAGDSTGIVTLWNNGAEKLFGYSRDEILGQSVDVLVPADRRGEDQALTARVLAGERVQHFDTIWQRKDGALISVSLTVSPIRAPSGEILGVSRIARDISERTRIERDARRLAAIVDSSDDAIVSKNLDGIVQTWNLTAERMFGYTAPEMIGRSITTIIPDDRLPEEDEVLRRIRKGQSIEHYETLRRAKDGTLVPISLTVSPIRDRSGVVIGASKIARDLSALRRYANTLEQTVKERTAALETANTQLEAFAYSVSHDLRAPLRGMQGLAHALLEDYGEALDERGREYASRIVDEAKVLDQLIRDLLAYSRLTHIEVPMDVVDLADVLESSVHNLREDIAAKHAIVQIAPDPPPIKANRTVLIQVFTNLISNAVKFGGDRPTVNVRAEENGQSVRVTVEDQGIGIAPQHQERVFRAFERLHGVESYPGTGMGLAIVRKGVERLGGRVGVESAEGRGSRFWVELPRPDPA
jgi:PAS domain S-box-containing protein